VQLGYRLVERGEPGTTGPGELGKVSIGDLMVADDPLNGNVRVPGITGPEFVPRAAGGPVQNCLRGGGRLAFADEHSSRHSTPIGPSDGSAVTCTCSPTATSSRHRGKDQRKGFTETGYAQLPNAAHQQLAGPLVVVWDNLNSFVSAAMTELVADRDWLTVYQLPPYAHELNPVEPVWSHLKRSLANLAKRNLAQPTALVKTRLRRMQYRPALLEGFLASIGLDLTPFCNPRNERSLVGLRIW
jgi:hypothetical protein